MAGCLQHLPRRVGRRKPLKLGKHYIDENSFVLQKYTQTLLRGRTFSSNAITQDYVYINAVFLRVYGIALFLTMVHKKKNKQIHGMKLE